MTHFSSVTGAWDDLTGRTTETGQTQLVGGREEGRDD